MLKLKMDESTIDKHINNLYQHIMQFSCDEMDIRTQLNSMKTLYSELEVKVQFTIERNKQLQGKIFEMEYTIADLREDLASAVSEINTLKSRINRPSNLNRLLPNHFQTLTSDFACTNFELREFDSNNSEPDINEPNLSSNLCGSDYVVESADNTIIDLLQPTSNEHNTKEFVLPVPRSPLPLPKLEGPPGSPQRLPIRKSLLDLPEKPEPEPPTPPTPPRIIPRIIPKKPTLKFNHVSCDDADNKSYIVRDDSILVPITYDKNYNPVHNFVLQLDKDGFVQFPINNNGYRDMALLYHFKHDQDLIKYFDNPKINSKNHLNSIKDALRNRRNKLKNPSSNQAIAFQELPSPLSSTISSIFNHNTIFWQI